MASKAVCRGCSRLFFFWRARFSAVKAGLGKRKGTSVAPPPTTANGSTGGLSGAASASASSSCAATTAAAGAAAVAAGPASSHGKKRVWKRWGTEEEAALQRAVEKHGTKDWTAIVQVNMDT